MERKLKVGEKVRVKRDLKGYYESIEQHRYFNPSDIPLQGTIVTIKAVRELREDINSWEYEIEENSRLWFGTDFELVRVRKPKKYIMKWRLL